MTGVAFAVTVKRMGTVSLFLSSSLSLSFSVLAEV